MQTPPQFQFHGMKGTPAIEAAIANHVAELEKRFSRITACRDERHSDLTFALDDAFKHARSHQDQVRRMDFQVKRCNGLPIGRVASLDLFGEFGFHEAADGEKIYFHRKSVLDGAFSRLSLGSRMTFAEEQGDKGPQATTVKLLGKHGLRT